MIKKIHLSGEVERYWEKRQKNTEITPRLSSDELDRMLGSDTTDAENEIVRDHVVFMYFGFTPRCVILSDEGYKVI